MSWKQYREENEANFLRLTLEGLGLPEFYVKIRRLGSYAPEEVAKLQKSWTDKRLSFVTKKIQDLVNVDEAETNLSDEEREIRAALAVIDGEAPTSGASERQLAILNYLIAEGGLSNLNPIVGIDIELIYEWNLTNPNTDEPLPLPKEDMGVLMCIPADILWHIKEQLIELQEAIVPKKVKEMLSAKRSQQ